MPAWWEKTVEYKFVLEYLLDDANISPLSGSVEQAFGDALTQTVTGFSLIEFKREKKDIAEEGKKFKISGPTEYLSLRDEAIKASGWTGTIGKFPHYLVYGCPPEEGGGGKFPYLDLKQVPYWNPGDSETPCSMEEMGAFERHEQFRGYLKFLCKNRQGGEEAVGGSPCLVMTSDSNASVAGSGKLKKRWIALSALMVAWKLEPKHEFKSTPAPSPFKP